MRQTQASVPSLEALSIHACESVRGCGSGLPGGRGVVSGGASKRVSVPKEAAGIWKVLTGGLRSVAPAEIMVA